MNSIVIASETGSQSFRDTTLGFNGPTGARSSAQATMGNNFCEESLPDGSYRTLLESITRRYATGRFVVTLPAGEWDEYSEAIQLGATEVLKYPLQSIDVELALIRAARIKGAGSDGGEHSCADGGSR